MLQKNLMMPKFLLLMNVNVNAIQRPPKNSCKQNSSVWEHNAGYSLANSGKEGKQGKKWFLMD